MTTIFKYGVLGMTIVATLVADAAETPMTFYPHVQRYLEQRVGEFEQIPAERKQDLKKLANYVQTRREAREPIRLTFICTHNSRRSHLSQIWAAAAADYYHVSGVETFSGGTEATAFNPRAISVIERAGLKVEKGEDEKNPLYAVRFREAQTPLICFSKVYKEAPNPKSGFCAVMTCSQADKSCPHVEGAKLRLAIPYEDPKLSDGTPEETATYDERCRQICREMMYVFSCVNE